MATKAFKVKQGLIVGNNTTEVGNILDEDNMASDSATALATQQSIKAYVDTSLGALSSTSITQLNTNVTVSDTGTDGTVTVTADGNTEMDITDAGMQLGGSGARVNSILDEDAFGSDSATALATQQSIKAYVDAQDANIASDTLTLTNKTFDANGTGNSISNIDFADFASGVVLDQDDMSSDSATALATQQSIKAYVDGELSGLSQNSISQGDTSITITDSGSNGTITMKADNNNELIINDTGATFYGNMDVTGDLTVNGTTTTVNTTNTYIEDTLLALNNGVSASANTYDAGILINRGTGTDSSTINVAMIWDESANQFAMVETTETGATAGDVNITRYANLQVDRLTGTATQAQYADVAEKYTADADYGVGTVVQIGGTAEVTRCDADHSPHVVGVISENPALIMNHGLSSDHVALVGLLGRVLVNVTGKVDKGDMLVSAGNGMARAESNPAMGAVIGKALDSNPSGEATIEMIVGRV
ncbi:MAG: hypothetical protein VW270_18660 [Candidatus Poseidoniales archaeon]|jgi:membrane-bound inhibitor of C-type lysozyme